MESSSQRAPMLGARARTLVPRRAAYALAAMVAASVGVAMLTVGLGFWLSFSPVPRQLCRQRGAAPRKCGEFAWWPAQAVRANAAWCVQLRPAAVVLEGMNDSDGNTITPEYSVSAAMQSSALAIKHYPDPQAMPDAQLILSTENADASALRRLRTMAFKVHQMRTKASDTGRRWMNLLEKARDIEYSTLDMQSETPTLKKPRGEIGPPGPPGPQGVRAPLAVSA
jgi:hypothetical protein